MKINIATSHRFHLLDLAREFEKLGHDVHFYSYIPSSRMRKFGLSKKASHSNYYFVLPLLALVKFSKRATWSLKLLYLAQDYLVAWYMKPCDVYISLGLVYKYSIVKAKSSFNALTILEWASKHILEQHKILADVITLNKLDHQFTRRFISAYHLADYVSISSDHVKQSFIDNGFPENRLLKNPYGVDLSMFSPTELTKDKPYDLIMVGGWSYRKGCDLLIEVLKESNLTLLHVGPIVDLPFPALTNMTHVDAVDQSKLIDYYSKARIFILPSREEGLAYVQPQAIACGLPIVCSKHTGGRDLRDFLNEKKWIIEMEDYSTETILRCINNALLLADSQNGRRSYSGDSLNELKWASYAKRYEISINRLLTINQKR